jgi:hypothetical protein
MDGVPEKTPHSGKHAVDINFINAGGSHAVVDIGGNASVDFHGERRSNATHQSTTDPEARVSKKGKGGDAKLGLCGHAPMDNLNGLAVNGCVTQAGGRAEPQAARAMAEKIPGWRRVTLGTDKDYVRCNLFVDSPRPTI